MDYTDAFQEDDARAAEADLVTRQQGGQFIEEGSEVIRTIGEDVGFEADADASIVNADTSSVRALQVTMERAGADYIQTQKAFLTNSGARQISGESSRLSNSGVLQLHTDSADLHNSSAFMARTTSMHVDKGSVMFATADKASFEGDANVGILRASDVQANGNVRAFMIGGGNVRAGGEVYTTISTQSAMAGAAVFGAIVALILRVLGKRNRT